MNISMNENMIGIRVIHMTIILMKSSYYPYICNHDKSCLVKEVILQYNYNKGRK